MSDPIFVSGFPEAPEERIPLLVVDDDPDVLQVTRLVLAHYQFQGKSLEIVEASSAAQAKEILQRRSDFAAVLLDVVMESDDAGLRLVEYIRQALGNYRLRIILRTGQPGYAPERRVVKDYDINDYLMKADATQARLTVSVTTAIRGYFDILKAESLAVQVRLSEQASIAKTQFLAHMSHEIRTPLSGVVGIVSLLAETSLTDEQQVLINDLQLAADALLGVVNDVLDVAKIEAGKLELHLQTFRPQLLINKVAAVFSASLQRKHIDFRIQSSLPEGTFVADAQRIQQILINYLSNAQKFTPEGGRIVLRASLQQRGELSTLVVEVEDSGPGIRSERLASIFEAYEQESSSTAAQYGGTGLGLSLCRSFAQLMSGEVGADSEPGRGSRFWLSVPLQAGADPSAGTAPVAGQLNGQRILMAEDDVTIQKVMSRILQNQGADVVSYMNGRSLLESSAWQNAYAILLDFHMPLLDGPACARELRKRGYQGLILALTGAVTGAEREACLAAGMDDVVIKPVDRQRLLEALAAGQSRT